jgi:hypothetical protein
MKRDLPRSPSSRSVSRSSSKRSPSPATAPRGASHPKSPEVPPPRRKSIFGSLRASKPSRHYSTAPGFHDDRLGAPAQESTRNDEDNLNHLFSTLDHGAAPPPTAAPPINPSSSSCEETTSDTYEDDLDKMPCMLYIHGGGQNPFHFMISCLFSSLCNQTLTCPTGSIFEIQLITLVA